MRGKVESNSTFFALVDLKRPSVEKVTSEENVNFAILIYVFGNFRQTHDRFTLPVRLPWCFLLLFGTLF